MNKVPSQTTCCSLENPITNCRGTLENTPPGNLSPSAHIRGRTLSSLSTSLAHSVSLSFTLNDFLSPWYSSFPYICLCFSSPSFINLLFNPSSCLVLSIPSSQRLPLQLLCISMSSVLPFIPVATGFSQSNSRRSTDGCCWMSNLHLSVDLTVTGNSWR